MAATTTGMESSRAVWRKSTRSNGGEGACVEVATIDEATGATEHRARHDHRTATSTSLGNHTTTM